MFPEKSNDIVNQLFIILFIPLYKVELYFLAIKSMAKKNKGKFFNNVMGIINF